ncbi:MAG: usg protein [Hyphomicrobiaceae bacterium]
MRSLELANQLRGLSLTTTEVLYRMPDHPSLLQSFVWQCYDEHPRFPRINRFLAHWVEHIEARLHSVRVAHKGLISPAELRWVEGEFRLH